VATQARVEQVFRNRIRRFDETDPTSKPSVSAPRSILCEIPDLKLMYRGDYRDGKIQKFSRVKNHSTGDITIEVSSDDLVALAEGRMSLTRAIFTGRLSVDAGASDLMLLRQLL